MLSWDIRGLLGPVQSSPLLLELEQRVEGRPGVAGRRLVAVLGELLGLLGGEESALVAVPLLGDPGRDLRVLAALPARRGVEMDAVGAGVEVSAATRAGGVEGQRLFAEDDEPFLAAGGAAEDRLRRGAETAAARAFLLLARALKTRPRTLVAALRVLVSPLAVFLFVGHWNPFSRRSEDWKG